MKKPLLIAFAVASMGCANIKKLEQDVARLENSLRDVRAFQAEQTSKINTTENQLRATIGRVDELEFAQSREMNDTLSNLQSDLSRMKRRVPPPAIVPLDALEEDERILSTLPREVGQPFQDALQHIREGEFQRSLAPLDEVATLAAGTDWAPLAIFWTAVSYDGMNEHKRALENYHEMVTRFRKHPRLPLALLRQASVFIRMGDSKMAGLTLKKLIADFPRTSEAARAKERLKDL